MNHDYDTNLEQEARLTAYVLGELEGDDAAAVEAQIESDHALKREVEQIRRTVIALATEMKAEPSPGLTSAQRDVIASGANNVDERDHRPLIFTLRTAWAGVALAAAACLTFAIWISMDGGARGPADDIAFGDKAATGPVQPSSGAVTESARDEELFYFGTEGDVAGKAGENLGLSRRLNAPTDSQGLQLSQLEAGARELLKSVDDERVAGQSRGQAAADGPAVVNGRSRESETRADTFVGTIKASAPPAPPASPSSASTGRRPPPPARPAPGPGSGISGDGGGYGGGGAGGGKGGSIFGEPASPSRRLADRLRPEFHGDIPVAGELFRHPEGGSNSDGAFREGYGRLVDNPFIKPTGESALSTFSIDVDTASYANVRRYLNNGQLPPPDAVRLEELINYFDYDYPEPSGNDPFSVNVEVNQAPWNDAHRLVRIGLKGREVDMDMRPATNLVFLLDVSGSMNDRNKLPLVKDSIRMLIEHLTADDRVAMVVYAGASGLVLPSTYCDDKAKVLAALDQLSAGGSTNGGAGIELAYKVATDHFIQGGLNRVILCTDGDFNVGISDDGSLVRLIEAKRETGVFLSVLGFGTGNFQDEKMEQLSNHGNGNFAYIDSIDEANKVLIREMAGTLLTIAKDVKIQVEFNPAQVQAYRLIGYANRLLEAQDFNDDKKDAGEIGSGHTVTALYEIVPPGVKMDESDGAVAADVDELKYQPAGNAETPKAGAPASRVSATSKTVDDTGVGGSDVSPVSNELLTVKLRYKQPEANESTLIEHPVTDLGAKLNDASSDVQFAAAVASFGMLLRHSEYRGESTYPLILDLAAAALTNDPHGERAEFINLVKRAQEIDPRK